MEEKKKSPLSNAFTDIIIKQRGHSLITTDEEENSKKGAFSNYICISLAAIFVLSLGCFAVYTMSYSRTPAENPNAENYSTAHPLIFKGMNDESNPSTEVNMQSNPQNVFPKPEVVFEVIVNGKKIAGNDEKESTKTPIDKQKTDLAGILPLTNFIKNLSPFKHNEELIPEENVLKSVSKSSTVKSNDNSTTVKPVIKTYIKTIEFGKLPDEFSTRRNNQLDIFKPMRDPFDDILDSFFPFFPQKMFDEKKNDASRATTWNPPKENRRVTIFTTVKAPTTKKSNDGSQFPSSVFRDAQDMLKLVDHLFEEKIHKPSGSEDKNGSQNKPTVFKITRAPVFHIFPMSSLFYSKMKPVQKVENPDVEVFKKTDQHPFDRIEKKSKLPDETYHDDEISSETKEKQVEKPYKSGDSSDRKLDRESISAEEMPQETSTPKVSAFNKTEGNSEIVKTYENEEKNEPTTQGYDPQLNIDMLTTEKPRMFNNRRYAY